MVIVPMILLGVLLVSAFTEGINDGLPNWKQPICLRPADLIYALPRIVAPFLIFHISTPLGVVVGILLYLLAFGIKILFWKIAYGITPYFKS